MCSFKTGTEHSLRVHTEMCSAPVDYNLPLNDISDVSRPYDAHEATNAPSSGEKRFELFLSLPLESPHGLNNHSALQKAQKLGSTSKPPSKMRELDHAQYSADKVVREAFLGLRRLISASHLGELLRLLHRYANQTTTICQASKQSGLSPENLSAF